MIRYFAIILCAILCSTLAIADVIRVPQDQPSIQAAINASVNGDTVLVAESVYFENIRFKGKSIVVASHFIVDKDTSHISNTIINGSKHSNPDSGSVVYFTSGEDSNSVLSGFTITGGTGTTLILIPPYVDKDGGGILIINSGATIENNKIIYNHTSVAGDTFTGGSAISVTAETGNYIVIRDNEISYNTATNTGNGQAAGAVGFGTKEICRFEKNWVHHNVCDAANMNTFAGGLFIDGSLDHHGPYLIRNNIISNNSLNAIGSSGGGIFIQNSSPILINNIISGNFAPFGGGIWIYHWTFAAIEAPKPILINNTIINNRSTGGGNAILIGGTPETEAKLMNNIVWGNSGPTNNQIAITDSASVQVRYSIIQGSYTGEGNINADPLIIADSLINTSPCIGAGSRECDFGDGNLVQCPLYDIKGRTRPYPADSRPDIGAWESLLNSPATGVQSQKVSDIAKRFTLYQNFPNPFNPITTIKYSLAKSEHISLKIYNTAGQELAILVNGFQKTGTYKVDWNTEGLPSGIYLCKLKVGEFSETKKLILQK